MELRPSLRCLRSSSHVLPTIRSNVRREFGYKRSLSSFDNHPPPRSVWVIFPKADSISSSPFPLPLTLPLSFFSSVPQVSILPILPLDSSYTADSPQ